MQIVSLYNTVVYRTWSLMKYEVVVIIRRRLACFVIIIGAGAKQSTWRSFRKHGDMSDQPMGCETQALVLVAPRVPLHSMLWWAQIGRWQWG